MTINGREKKSKSWSLTLGSYFCQKFSLKKGVENY